MIKQLEIRGFDKNFSYFVGSSKTREILVVDPGDTDHLIAEINHGEFKPQGILITHSHFDHIEGVGPLLKYFEMPVYMHSRALNRVKEAQEWARPLEDGDFVEVGGLKIEVLHTPGHIDDAVCYLIREGEAEDGVAKLITGDTLFVEGCGRADLGHSEPEVLYESLQRLKALDPGTKVYPGHDYGSRKVSTIGWELQKNKYMRCETKEDFLRLRMARSRAPVRRRIRKD